MYLKIYNEELEPIGMMDDYNSVECTQNYYEPSRMMIKATVTPEWIEMCKIGNLFVRSDDLNTAYVLMDISDSDQFFSQDEITLTLYDLRVYLARRVIAKTLYPDNLTEYNVRQIVYYNCIQTEAARVIPRLELGKPIGLGRLVKYQVSDENILEEIQKQLEADELSCRVRLDAQNKKLIFEVWKGWEKPNAIFAQKFENVLSEYFNHSILDLKTTAYVKGEGEGPARQLVIVNNTPAGLNRFELSVDARDLQRTEYNDNNEEITMPLAEYIKVLTERGELKLAEFKEVLNFESKVDAKGNIRLNEDFSLGDVVTHISEKWGITIKSRITSITEIFNREGYELQLSFGNQVVSTASRIKRMVSK